MRNPAWSAHSHAERGGHQRLLDPHELLLHLAGRKPPVHEGAENLRGGGRGGRGGRELGREQVGGSSLVGGHRTLRLARKGAGPHPRASLAHKHAARSTQHTRRPAPRCRPFTPVQAAQPQACSGEPRRPPSAARPSAAAAARARTCALLASVNSVQWSTLKWRRKRLVTGLRPPPGGPIALTTCRSTRRRKVLSLRSYLRGRAGGEGVWGQGVCGGVRRVCVWGCDRRVRARRAVRGAAAALGPARAGVGWGQVCVGVWGPGRHVKLEVRPRGKALWSCFAGLAEQAGLELTPRWPIQAWRHLKVPW